MESASGKPFFPTPETNSTTLVGMPVVRPFARMHPTHTSNGAILSCRYPLASRIYVLDTKPDPRNPSIVKIIQPEEVFARTGYSRPHTVHCGPDGIYVSALGSPDGDGPGGIFLLDHFSFDVLENGKWIAGPMRQIYDFWWHLTRTRS